MVFEFGRSAARFARFLRNWTSKQSQLISEPLQSSCHRTIQRAENEFCCCDVCICWLFGLKLTKTKESTSQLPSLDELGSLRISHLKAPVRSHKRGIVFLPNSFATSRPRAVFAISVTFFQLFQSLHGLVYLFVPLDEVQQRADPVANVGS